MATANPNPRAMCMRVAAHRPLSSSQFILRAIRKDFRLNGWLNYPRKASYESFSGISVRRVVSAASGESQSGYEGEDEIEDDGWGRDSFNYEEELEKKFPGSKEPLAWPGDAQSSKASPKKKMERPWERKEKVKNVSDSNAEGASKRKVKKPASVNFRENREEAGTSSSEKRSFFRDPNKPVLNDFAVERRKAKNPATRPQVTFSTPMSKSSEIAIIGGGISGVMCALTLAENGIKSTVFDTGKHGLGGRMATRHLALPDGRKMVFDHAAQYFTASNPKFQAVVDKWESAGLIREWKGKVGKLQAGGIISELAEEVRYVGVGGMRQLCDQLVKQSPLISVERPTWVSHLDARGDIWALREGTRSLGDFQGVIIAHNGKCANRLLATAGVPLLTKQMKRLELSSIWALMAAFEKPLPPPSSWAGSELSGGHLEGAFVEGLPAVAWMSNNSAKLVGEQNSDLQCWTFLSSKSFGNANKVPQEAIPKARANRVTAAMLAAVENALGLAPGDLPSPVFTKAQLWGAALPLNAPGTECILDSVGRVGICGDWLLAPSVEGAVLSGMAMAEQMAKLCEHEGEVGELSVGLDTVFSPVGGHDIGQFVASIKEAETAMAVT